ncbi:hypothetical protein VTN00DRAFT_964 [Thermoascus crustaceus]
MKTLKLLGSDLIDKPFQ